MAQGSLHMRLSQVHHLVFLAEWPVYDQSQGQSIARWHQSHCPQLSACGRGDYFTLCLLHLCLLFQAWISLSAVSADAILDATAGEMAGAGAWRVTIVIPVCPNGFEIKLEYDLGNYNMELVVFF
jgi:hypothetical protein